jgi:hypothetical protein
MAQIIFGQQLGKFGDAFTVFGDIPTFTPTPPLATVGRAGSCGLIESTNMDALIPGSNLVGVLDATNMAGVLSSNGLGELAANNLEAVI